METVWEFVMIYFHQRFFDYVDQVCLLYSVLEQPRACQNTSVVYQLTCCLFPVCNTTHWSSSVGWLVPSLLSCTLHSPTSKRDKKIMFVIHHNIMAFYLSHTKAQTHCESACTVSLLRSTPSLTQKETRKQGITH